MKRFKDLKECIEQLEKVGFVDKIGHTLEMNVAFVQLKELLSVDNIEMPYVGIKESCGNCLKRNNCKLKEPCKSRNLICCRFYERDTECCR